MSSLMLCQETSIPTDEALSTGSSVLLHCHCGQFGGIVGEGGGEFLLVPNTTKRFSDTTESGVNID